uniref:Uncharacterized protein n=1 Tax=Timema genevievae TaxID=629358 RepID=A0A7R9K4W8_TIMGE|nr:unnamed protein product [Timema genevievae]
MKKEMNKPPSRTLSAYPPRLQSSSPSLIMAANSSSPSSQSHYTHCTTSSPHPVLLPPLPSCIHPEPEVVCLDHDLLIPSRSNPILLPPTPITSWSFKPDGLDRMVIGVGGKRIVLDLDGINRNEEVQLHLQAGRESSKISLITLNWDSKLNLHVSRAERWDELEKGLTKEHHHSYRISNL